MFRQLSARFKFSLLVVLFAVVGLSWPSLARAQNATITGTVTDSSQAPVSGVAVTARNTATNAIRTAQTNDDGLYRLIDVSPGQYDLTFEKAGFELAKFAAVQVTVGQILTVDTPLQVGAVSSTIEVSGAMAPPIELQNAQLSNLVDSKRITDLPLLTRDPYQLILLSPGVVQSNSGLGGFSANGTRYRQRLERVESRLHPGISCDHQQLCAGIRSQ